MKGNIELFTNQLSTGVEYWCGRKNVSGYILRFINGCSRAVIELRVVQL